MLTLYQFPISHYCEKVRWTLDHKKLEYRVTNLLPGLHRRTGIKLAGSSSLPILVHGNNVIQNSSTIITYLDQYFPDPPLTPKDESLKQEALSWEAFADDEIGPSVRLVCYNTLLDYPEILVPFFTAGNAWYCPYLLKPAFPALSKTMRNAMNIHADTATAANRKLSAALAKISEHLENRPFLVGDRLSRADIAVAALLAPLCRPKGYGLEWPERFPEPLATTMAEHAEKLAWVNAVYASYR